VKSAGTACSFVMRRLADFAASLRQPDFGQAADAIEDPCAANGRMIDGRQRQGHAAQWGRTYGGVGSGGTASVQPTAHGGYVVAGNTRSFGAGDADAWVLKLDANGAIPGCPYMVDADATVADSDATTASSTVIAADANATQASGMANAADSTGVQSEQCRYPQIAASLLETIAVFRERHLIRLMGLQKVLGFGNTHMAPR
jgi:hypothetical protein